MRRLASSSHGMTRTGLRRTTVCTTAAPLSGDSPASRSARAMEVATTTFRSRNAMKRTLPILQRKQKMSTSIRCLSIVGLLFLMSLPASAAVVTIDKFETAQTVETDLIAPASAANSLNTATALGVERDLAVDKTAGDAGERIRARVNPGGLNLLRQSLDDARGRTAVTWDGPDGLPGTSQVDFDGLGGFDFAAQSSQVDLSLTFSDLGGPIRFTFWDADDPTGATFATGTMNAPGGVISGSMVPLSLPFASLAPTGGTLVDILDSVGAVQMIIDATALAQEGWDMRIDFLQTSGAPFFTPPTNGEIPEPSTLLLLGVGAVLVLPFRRRRQRS